jgi:hypothetical protein
MAVSNVQPALLEQNRHQGYFAEAFIASIAAAAGLDVFLPRLGDKADLQVYTPGPNGTSGSRQICVQVKSWSTGRLSPDGFFHYPLEVSAYNHLAGDNDVRHYLALCMMPRQVHLYADAQHSRLNLKRAAYWLSLKGMEINRSLSETSTKVVHVPKRNLLTPETIRALVERDELSAVVE